MTTIVDGGDKLVALPAAPPVLDPQYRRTILMTLPGGKTVTMPYAEAEEFHKALGQELARGMRAR